MLKGIALISLLFLSACSQAPKSQVKKIDLKDFFKNAESRSYELSSDGQWLAYLKPYKSRMNIFVRPVADESAEVRLTSVTDRDIAGITWKGPRHILFVRDFGGDENYHVFSVDVKTKKLQDLTPYKETRVRITDDLEGISSSEILISMNKRDKRIFDVYRLNIKTGKTKLVAKNPGKFMGWMTDHKGKVRVAIESDGVNNSIFYRDNERQKFRKILTTDFRDSVSPIVFTADNKKLIVLSNLGRDKVSLAEFDPKKKRETRLIYQNDTVDVSGISYSKKQKKILAARYYTWKGYFSFFDIDAEKRYQKVQSKLPNLEVRFTSSNKAENLWVVRTFSDKTRGAYYIYDEKKDNLKKIAELSPWLNESEMADMKPIQYKSRDGLTIQGYLTLPKGADPKNLPVVINPHGGPWARDRWGFNSQVQFLANRGYAVLQMNFRGSTGFGKKFWQASFKQWGLKMQDDVSDGVQWLIDKGIADKDRVCIYGASYGGYATLAGLAYTPNLYACGVDYVGVSNIFTLLETIPPYWKPMLDKLYAMIGHPEKEKELLRAASPVFHVDRIKAPLLVAQGAKDPRVKQSESDQIVAALKKKGIDVPYLLKENEGHGFRNEENRFEFYMAMEDFLKKHIQ